MVQVKKFDRPPEFIKYNEEILHTQYFQHFHIHRELREFEEGNNSHFDAFNIIDDDGSNVIIIRLEQLLFVYSQKWNNSVIECIQSMLTQISQRPFLIRGQKKIVNELMDRMAMKYEVINDRIIYDCVKANPINKKVKGKFGIAKVNDIPAVMKMSFDYYTEEFEGKGKQSKESVLVSAYDGVLRSEIYKWSNDGRIVSIARIIGDNKENIMIGGLYTKVSERNKGFAYFLTSELTRYLLEKGAKKCGLLTEATKIPTNKIFEKTGYEKVYEWVNVVLK